MDAPANLIEPTLHQEQLSALTIRGAAKLDPILLVIHNVRYGAGRIVIQCASSAWTAYWGAMGERTVKEFFIGVDDGYLLGCLRGNERRPSKSDDAYLLRIIGAVKYALSSNIGGAE